MIDEKKKYFNFKIEDLDINPSYPWDFSRMHKAYSFNLSWVDKYPDKPWDFKSISQWERFEIWIVEKYPEKCWDFSEMHLCWFFDIDWVEKFPDRDWCFEKMHELEMFDITWVDKFPDKPWDFSNMDTCKQEGGRTGEYCELYQLKLDWIEKYPNKPWNFQQILSFEETPLKQLTLQQFKKLTKFSTQEICKYLIIKKYIPHCKIYNLYEGVFHQIDEPIQLQDLSGNIYYLENWFKQDNLLEYAKEQLPALGEFDIGVESQDGSEEILMASNTDVKAFKNHLFQGKEGPQGIIVYL